MLWPDLGGPATSRAEIIMCDPSQLQHKLYHYADYIVLTKL